MKTIPNALSCKFSTVKGRKQLICEYGNSDTMYSGKNEDGENVTVSIDYTGIVLNTYQHNGWVRVNYYDADGNASGETFNGKWK